MAFSTTLPGTSSSASLPVPNRLPDCPPGYYACPTGPGEEPTVLLGQQGRERYWPALYGWSTTDQVVGGRLADRPLSTACLAVEAIANAILGKFGLDNAGHFSAPGALVNLGNQQQSLTKKASRTLSMGRYCAYQNDQGEEWDASTTTYGDARGGLAMTPNAERMTSITVAPVRLVTARSDANPERKRLAGNRRERTAEADMANGEQPVRRGLMDAHHNLCRDARRTRTMMRTSNIILISLYAAIVIAVIVLILTV